MSINSKLFLLLQWHVVPRSCWGRAKWLAGRFNVELDIILVW